MDMNTALLGTLLNMLFPPHCVFCDDVTYPTLPVCVECLQEVRKIHGIRRMKIGNTGETVLCIVPYSYEGKVRESILRFKFYGYKDHAKTYAKSIVEELQSSAPAKWIDIVTAVPLSVLRMRARGYNQAELVARETANLLALDYMDCINKIKENKVQHELDRKERAKNVRDVYQLLSEVKVEGKSILLIDDIITTGATLCECAGVLLRAGAKSVTCAAIAEVK